MKKFLIAAISTGEFKKMINKFRFQVIIIQRVWRHLMDRRGAETGLVIKKWEVEWTKLKQALKALEAEIEVLRQKKNISVRERVAAREVLDDKVAALPKFNDGGRMVNLMIKQKVATAWVNKNRKRYKARMRAYLDELREYHEGMQEFKTVISARRVLGATRHQDNLDLPQMPTKPTIKIFPPTDELYALITEGAKLMKVYERKGMLGR